MVLGKDFVVVLDSDFPPSCNARLNSRRARCLRETDGGHRHFHRSRVSSASGSDGKTISIWAFSGHASSLPCSYLHVGVAHGCTKQNSKQRCTKEDSGEPGNYQECRTVHISKGCCKETWQSAHLSCRTRHDRRYKEPKVVVGLSLSTKWGWKGILGPRA